MSHHSPGTVVVLRPVTAGEVGIGDRGAGIGGMDELAAANVNAYMGNAAGICTGKENDVAGCLPIVLQIPVFLALYWVLLASVELRGSEWILWVNDLAMPDSWLVLPAIMMVTMILQMLLNPAPMDPMQKKIMYIMPIVFGVMFFFFASGLVLYWLTNNVLSIAQQWYVNRQIATERARRLAAANEKEIIPERAKESKAKK